MPTVATFGEIMLRLATPGFSRFVQTTNYDATYGGGEANVAAALAQFGIDARYITLLPGNEIGQAAVNSLRQFGVDTRYIVRKGSRVGIYYLESGSAQRASKVIYDRANSAIAEVQSGDIDWEAALAGVDIFHWTGITPAISEGAARECLIAVQTAKRLGVKVSCDLNFRKNLWKWGKTASEIMPGLVENCDLAIGNEEDADKVFGIKAPGSDVEAGKVDAEAYRYVAEKLVERFPSLKQVAITLRGSISASHNTWSGVLYSEGAMFMGRQYDIVPIVDRVGGGDSFAAGLIYGLSTGKSAQDALDFAIAASCLKHSIYGDFNMVSVAEVEALVKGGGSGRVQR